MALNFFANSNFSSTLLGYLPTITAHTHPLYKQSALAFMVQKIQKEISTLYENISLNRSSDFLYFEIEKVVEDRFSLTQRCLQILQEDSEHLYDSPVSENVYDSPYSYSEEEQESFYQEEKQTLENGSFCAFSQEKEIAIESFSYEILEIDSGDEGDTESS